MMRILCYKVLWTIVHLLANIAEAFHNLRLEFQQNLFNFIKNLGQHNKNKVINDRLVIENHLHVLEKLPKHLGVILNATKQTDVDVRQLAKIVFWALSSGVNFISFYDYKGILKHQISQNLYEAIEQLQLDKNENENVVWGPNFQKPSNFQESIRFPHKNGFIRHIVVNIYSSEDGQVKFNQLLTHGVKSKEWNSQDLTTDSIDQELNKFYGLPDPDLAIYFGSSCCTKGFMPWQIRLTEFIEISHKLQSLSLEKYLLVLYKFAKCEQRFGK